MLATPPHPDKSGMMAGLNILDARKEPLSQATGLTGESFQLGAMRTTQYELNFLPEGGISI
jgi:hypothetical protein